MNPFALLRNALWIACLLAALIILGIAVSQRAKFTGNFPVCESHQFDGFPVFIGDFNGDGKPDLAYIIQQYSIVFRDPAELRQQRADYRDNTSLSAAASRRSALAM